MKQKLYLDTSIPSAYYDFSKPLRQHITQKWFENETRNFQLFISTITIQEINKLQNAVKKENIFSLILRNDVQVLENSDQANNLAKLYCDKGAIPKSEFEDALHIAIATINEIDSLASWNFKHIVSINPIRKIHEINEMQNLGRIEINSLEVFGGYKYGNL